MIELGSARSWAMSKLITPSTSRLGAMTALKAVSARSVLSGWHCTLKRRTSISLLSLLAVAVRARRDSRHAPTLAEAARQEWLICGLDDAGVTSVVVARSGERAWLGGGHGLSSRGIGLSGEVRAGRGKLWVGLAEVLGHGLGWH